MYKFIQVHEGENEWDFRVPAGKTLNILVYGIVSFNARLTVRLTGTAARAIITGILIGTGDTKQTLHTVQSHEAPETTSNLLVKTVMSGRVTCLFDGSIRVDKQAQKTDAYQRNENLLLSGDAFVRSRPSLEILADDVRCTHGAATGPVDEEQVWYLMSRGVSRARAESLLVAGFIQSALDRIPVGKRDIISLWHNLQNQ